MTPQYVRTPEETAAIQAELAELIKLPHSITWTFDRNGTYGRLHCSAPVGAECRLWCAEGCEEACSDWENHKREDQGFCLAKEWIDNSGWPYEFYSGPETSPRDGPIRFEWNGNDWTWTYEGAPAQ